MWWTTERRSRTDGGLLWTPLATGQQSHLSSGSICCKVYGNLQEVHGGWAGWHNVLTNAQSCMQNVMSRCQWCCKCLVVSAWLHMGLVLSQIFLFCYLIKQCLCSFRNQMDFLTVTNPSSELFKIHWPFRKTAHCLGRCAGSELLCSICNLTLRRENTGAVCLFLFVNHRWARLKEKDVFSVFCQVPPWTCMFCLLICTS